MERSVHAITSLTGLDAAMAKSREARVRLAESILSGRAIAPGDVAILNTVLKAILDAPRRGGRTRLETGLGRSIDFDLTFETRSLEQDLVFCTRGEAALIDLLAAREPGFAAETPAGIEALGGRRWRCLLADRDGTLLDYCGRYASSIQPAWNAVFLARFCREKTERAIMLTSGPLENGGLPSVTTLPPGIMDLAASKGREWLTRDGTRGAVPLPPAAAARLDELAERLTALLARPEFAVFCRIGSGFQHKHGELTIAHQDAFGSVDAGESARFLDAVRKLVGEIDPTGKHLSIEDTGLDIEIGLAALGKAFDKGQALAVLDATFGLDLTRGPILVCGDTAADLSMLRAALDRTPDVQALFVTRSKALAAEVRALCPEAVCVGAPATLMAILNGLAGR